MTDLQTVCKQLSDVREAMLERLVPLSQPELDWSPPPNRTRKPIWSLGEVFMHIALDEIYLRELIACPLIEGVQPPDEVRFIGIVAIAVLI